MKTVPSKEKHQCRITIDDAAFYYAKGCKIFPTVHKFYFDSLTHLEKHGKVCLTPSAILERYHMQFKIRTEEKAKKVQNKR